MKKKAKKATYELTIDDFIAVVPWDEVERKMGKREYKKFTKWMFGQTCLKEGVYVWDLRQYLAGGRAWD